MTQRLTWKATKETREGTLVFCPYPLHVSFKFSADPITRKSDSATFSFLTPENTNWGIHIETSVGL